MWQIEKLEAVEPSATGNSGERKKEKQRPVSSQAVGAF